MEMYRYQVDRGIERISKPPYCIFRVNLQKSRKACEFIRPGAEVLLCAPEAFNERLPKSWTIREKKAKIDRGDA